MSFAVKSIKENETVEIALDSQKVNNGCSKR